MGSVRLSSVEKHHFWTSCHVFEVQSVVNLMLNFDGFAETEVVMAFFQSIEVDIFIVLDPRLFRLLGGPVGVHRLFFITLKVLL